MHATSSGHSRHSGPGFRIRRRAMTAASVTAILSTVLALSPTHSSASPKGSGSRAVKPTAIVSLGDSFISGEGGRWQGNVDMPYSATDSMFGTDRATVCGSSGCRKDPEHVYVGNSYRDPTTGKENGCHRSDVAEINESRIPVDRKFNLACSGAVTDHLLPAAAGGRRFKGKSPRRIS